MTAARVHLYSLSFFYACAVSTGHSFYSFYSFYSETTKNVAEYAVLRHTLKP